MKKLWCFWANLNNLTTNRKKSLDLLYKFAGVDIELVTENSIYDLEIKECPIHEGFKYLSDTDKGDYARCYLTHHYGGGYTDIKPFTMNWNKYFDYLENPIIDLVGPPEPGPYAIAYEPAKSDYHNLVCVHKYILRKKSIISTEWYKEVNKLLDENLISLISNPGWYHPRAVSKNINPTGVFQNEDNKIYTPNYPMFWNYSGSIFHKIQHKYKYRISTSMQMEHFSIQQYR